MIEVIMIEDRKKRHTKLRSVAGVTRVTLARFSILTMRQAMFRLVKV